MFNCNLSKTSTQQVSDVTANGLGISAPISLWNLVAVPPGQRKSTIADYIIRSLAEKTECHVNHCVTVGGAI